MRTMRPARPHAAEMLYECDLRRVPRATGPRSLVRERRPALDCPDCGVPTRALAVSRPATRDHGSSRRCCATIGVLGNKHIPAAYLRAAERQRRELLAGLLDTDGTVVTARRLVPVRRDQPASAPTTSTSWSSASATSAAGRRKRVQGRTEATSTCYILNFSTTDDVFRLERKHAAHKEERPASTARIGRRYITAVRRVPSVPVRCVQVDNDDHLYLAGRSMIPTHNSTLALDLCRAASIHNNLTSVLLQPGDDPLGDHDAAALGRGARSRSTTSATAR